MLKILPKTKTKKSSFHMQRNILMLIILCFSMTLMACQEKKDENEELAGSEEVPAAQVEEDSENPDNTVIENTEEELLSDKDMHYNTGIEPDTDYILKVQGELFENVSNEDDLNIIKKTAHSLHMYIESDIFYTLQYSHKPDSPAWNNIDDDPNDDVIPAHTGEDFINDITMIYELLNNELCKNDIETMKEQMEYVLEAHDIETFYLIHQEIHDFDYWLINYPTENLEMAPPDWNGINVYFDVLECLQK